MRIWYGDASLLISGRIDALHSKQIAYMEHFFLENTEEQNAQQVSLWQYESTWVQWSRACKNVLSMLKSGILLLLRECFRLWTTLYPWNEFMSNMKLNELMKVLHYYRKQSNPDVLFTYNILKWKCNIFPVFDVGTLHDIDFY